MSKPHNLFDTLQTFDLGNGRQGAFYSLPALERAGVGAISRLPVSIRLVLESVLRNCDGKKVTEKNVRELAHWQPKAPRTAGNSVHRGPHCFAGFYGRAACWWIWRRCVRRWCGWGKIRR